MEDHIVNCTWPDIDPIIEIPLYQYIMEILSNSKTTHKLVVDAATSDGFTAAQIHRLSQRVSSGLRRYGVTERDTLLIYTPNNIHVPIAFLGTAMTGAIFTMANHNYKIEDLTHHMKNSKATYLLAHEDTAEVASQAALRCGGLKKMFVIGNFPGFTPFSELMNDDGSCFVPYRTTNMEDTSLLPFSSGTTGFPKGVMLSHKNVMTIVTMMRNPGFFPTLPTDVSISVIPFYHIYGFMVMAHALTHCTQLICLSKFEPTLFLRSIQNFKVSFLAMVPPMALFLAQSPSVLQYDLTSLREVICGAAPTPNHIIELLMKRLPGMEFKHAYGLTEMTFIAFLQRSGDKHKLGSVGTVVPYFQCKIVDIDTGSSLPAMEKGEVCLRSPSVMKGYYENQSSTAATIDNDGWLHTGDVGYYDEDGHFFVVDRVKELIKHKGLQVAPAELEALLATHPDVYDAAVIGVPDSRAGECARAYIVRNPGSKVTEVELQKFIADKVARHKHLYGGVVFVDEIPKSPSGKIIRRQLRDQAIRQNSKL